MAGEWSERRLGDVITLKRGYDLASTARRLGTIPIISSSGTSGFHDTAMVNGPGVITGRYGTIGEVFYTDENFWPLNTTLYVSDFKGSNPRFVSYYLKTLNFSAYSDKAAVPGINRNDLHEAFVLWPGLDEQIAIAGVLASLDAKIDLNRQMVATLEDTARVVFKSWFVHFDPVQAKAEGRDTGLPADLTALFPDSFDSDGLPLGWAWKRADEIARSVRSMANPRNMPAETPYVGLEHLPRKSLGIGQHGYARQVDSGKLYFKAGDLLFGKLRPYFHKVSVMLSEGIASSDIFVFRAKLEKYRGLMYFGFSDEKFVGAASGASTGTRMPRAEWSFMAEQLFASDDGEVLEAFNKIALSHVTQIGERLAECRKLEQLRDALLPKLLSGDLRVADAETAIAAA